MTFHSDTYSELLRNSSKVLGEALTENPDLRLSIRPGPIALAWGYLELVNLEEARMQRRSSPYIEDQYYRLQR